jgi:hypothetical protein
MRNRIINPDQRELNQRRLREGKLHEKISQTYPVFVLDKNTKKGTGGA